MGPPLRANKAYVQLVIPEDILEDPLQVSQHSILCPDHQHTLLPPLGWYIGTEILIRQDQTDRVLSVSKDDMVLRAGDAVHGLGVE